MHLVLTDVLTCPRCGPEFGLIVRADRLESRRVLEGALGCLNCREEYPVHAGVADLRLGAGDADGATAPPPGDEEAAFRLAALLGITEGPGLALLLGPDAALAAGLARIVPHLEVVTVAPVPGSGPETPGVSRLAAGGRLPLRDRAVRGVAVSGPGALGALPEAVRVLRPEGRIVLSGAGVGAAAAVEAMGLRALLDQDGIVVASPSAHG